jgi:8-oxo-dGTP pyrophosphatase MutT (NUDIX family)
MSNYIVKCSELVFNEFLKIRKDHLILPNDKEMNYMTLEMPETVSLLLKFDSKFPIISRYRHSVKTKVYDLPSGYMDKGNELPIEAASRECNEELGLNPKNIKFLFSGYPWAGISNAKHHYFYADTFEKTKTSLEETEIIDVEYKTFKEIEKIIKNGEAELSLIAGILYYRQMIKK